MKKRWLSIFVENEVGVLARIAGLFAGKSYNLTGLTVGTTEDESISHMTISLVSDDSTFEQVKKQLDRCIEVIRVLDYTDTPMHTKELMFLKITDCSESEKNELFQFAQVFFLKVLDLTKTDVLMESVHPDAYNDRLIQSLAEQFRNRLEVVRGGGVAIGAL